MLLLPEALLRKIQQEFPGYRVPEKEDRTGKWSEPWLLDRVPYAAWGDFDGDLLTDIALVLVGNGTWRFVIFQQAKEGGYASRDMRGVVKGKPQGGTLGVVKRGTELEKHGFNEQTAQTEVTGKVKFDVDVLVTASGESATYWHWNGREFERIHLWSYE